MSNHPRPKKSIQSLERGVEILELIMELEGAGVSELADRLDMPMSTVHGYLSTLYDLEYLVKEGDSYQISTRFLRLGGYSRERKREYRMAAKKVTALAEETGERSQFVIEEHGQGVFLYRAFGAHAVETDSKIGKRMYLHCTSAGKAILAHLPADEVESILATQGLPAVTGNTTTDEDALFDELSEIRDRGYSTNHQENIEGLNAIGVPVQTAQGEIFGSLSISGPSHRLKGDYLHEELRDLLLGTANELELNITYA